jgi:hypothetical protein
MVEAEGQDAADGQADDPVADDLDDEAGVGVAGSAQSAGGGDLEAVEELEEGGDEEQRDGRGDDGAIGGEGAGDGVGDEQKDGGEDGHAAGSEQDRGPTGGGCLCGVLATDGLADTDGSGGRDGEGNHEGEAGAVEGDLVAAEWKPAHDADEVGDDAEDGDFDEDLAAGWDSKEREASDTVGLEVVEHAAEAVAVTTLDAIESDDHEEGEIAAGDRGCEAGTGDSERGDVEWPPGVSVNEEPVAHDVDEVRGDQSEGDGTDVVERLQVAAEGEIEEERGCSVVECAEEGDRAVEDVVVDGQAQHHDRGEDDDEDESEGQTSGEDEAVQEPTVGLVEFACSVGLGEEGVEAEEDAAEAEGDGVVEDLAEGGGGDGESGVRHVADHDSVDDAHGHPADLRENEREGEGEDRSDLSADGHGLWITRLVLQAPPPRTYCAKVFIRQWLGLYFRMTWGCTFCDLAPYTVFNERSPGGGRGFYLHLNYS